MDSYKTYIDILAFSKYLMRRQLLQMMLIRVSQLVSLLYFGHFDILCDMVTMKTVSVFNDELQRNSSN